LKLFMAVLTSTDDLNIMY